MDKKYDFYDIFIYFCLGMVLVLVVLSDLMLPMSQDDKKLWKAIGFGFKDLWNLESDRMYKIELKDGKYSKTFKVCPIQ